MSRLGFHVSKKVEEQVREAAAMEGKSISSFLTELVKAHFPEKTSQKNDFSEFFGKWDGEFPSIERTFTQGRNE